MCLQRTAQKSRIIFCPLLSGNTPLIPRPNAHGTPLTGVRTNISVTLIIVLRVVPGDVTGGTGQCHQDRTLMTLHLVTATAHAVDANAGLTPKTVAYPDPAPLWSAVVRTVKVSRAAPRTPAVPIFLQGLDTVGQFKCLAILET